MDSRTRPFIGRLHHCRRVVSISSLVVVMLLVALTCAEAQDTAPMGFMKLGTTSGPVAVRLRIGTSGTLGAVEVLTEGATGLEFADAGTGTCNGTAAFAANDTCSVNVTFTPAYAGLRKGAVILKGTSGVPLATVFLYGMGVGPQVAFSPATESVVGIDLQRPAGVAVDGSGSVYIADTNNNRVVKGTLSHGVFSQAVFMSNLNAPKGIAIDGAGTVYIADSGNNRVLRVAVSGNISTVGSELSDPTGVAVDGRGNVYIADTTNNRVLKETYAGEVYSQTELATGLNAPSGVAVDPEGSIYIADSGSGRVLKLVLSGNEFSQAVIADASSGLVNPTAVALSGTGCIYIADAGNNRVLRLAASTIGYSESIVVDGGTNGLLNPASIAVAGSGDLYIADRDNSRVLKEDVTNALLNFGNVGVGYSGSANTKALTLTNVGNDSLNFVVPSASNNPSISGEFTLGSSSTCPQLSASSSPFALEAGSSCDFDISFNPSAEGSVAGSLTIADDALPQVQTVGLIGVGTKRADATIALNNLSQTYNGSPLAARATTTPPGLAVAITYNGSSSVPVDAGSYQVLAVVDDPNYQGTASGVLIVNKCALWVKTTDVSMTYGSAVPPLTGTVRGAAPGDDVTITYTTVATSASAVNAYTITPELPDNSRLRNYIIFLTNGVLTIKPAPLFVAANDVVITYGSAIPSLTGTLAGVVNNDPITATYSTAAIRTSPVGTYPITSTVVSSATVLANYAVTNTPGVLTIDKAPNSSVQLSTSGTSVHYGEPVVFTVRVSNGATVPDGSVAFYDDSALLRSVPLANGVAIYRDADLGIGNHAIRAIYEGSTNFAAADSGIVNQAVITPALSINASAMNSTLGTVTVGQGGSGSTSFQIASLGTLNSTVSVACSGLPAGIPCQVSPATINGGALPANVTVTVSTGNKIASGSLRDRGFMNLASSLALLLPGMIVVSRKRRLRLALMAIFAVALMMALSGCGGGMSTTSASTTSLRTTVSYTATITATSTDATSVTSSLTVVVPQS